MLLPLSQPPIVTAVAELATVGIAGLVALILGIRAWRTAPMNTAAFGGGVAAPSLWPEVLLGAAAVAGLVSAVIAVLQVVGPGLLQGPLGVFVEPTHLPGRAVGHVRQPNHLGTILLWGAVGWAVLSAQAHSGRTVSIAGMVLLIWALVLTGSRTGLLGLSLLVAWGLFDRTLPRHTRMLLASTPLIAVVAWWSMKTLSSTTGLAFGAPSHLAATSGGDISSSRFAIWRNTWTLIAEQPWSGVGWGRFNFAWTLTPMEARPTALFDHAHNLPLHLMVELGVPLGLAISAVWVALLFLAARRSLFPSWASPSSQGLASTSAQALTPTSAQVEGLPSRSGTPKDGMWRRAAFMLLAVVSLHSLLEYPLWYAYFGLPAAAALLVALGLDCPWLRSARWQALVQVLAGVVLCVLSVWASIEYQAVRAIYAPGPKAGPLKVRMEQGQRNTWFADHAHYAVATNIKPTPGQAWPVELERAFERAPMVLLDARLMRAWAQALATRNGPGDLDRARYLAARLREFNAAPAPEGVSKCEQAEAVDLPRYACEAPQTPLTWRAFMP